MGAWVATAACGSSGSALWIAAAGGAAAGATNNIIAQTGNGVGLNDVNWESVGISAGVGGVSGLAGYGAGKWATNSLGNPLINKLNVKGPAVSGLINGTIGGAAGGAGGGFLLSGGDIGAGLEGAWNGFTNGAIIGGGTGLGMGYYQARRSNVDPWSGKKLPAIHSNYADGTRVYKGQQPKRLPGPNADPDANGYSHSRLRWDPINKRIYQARTFDRFGNPLWDIDFTSPTFPNGFPRPHLSSPHMHLWLPNPTGGTPSRGGGIIMPSQLDLWRLEL